MIKQVTEVVKQVGQLTCDSFSATGYKEVNIVVIE